jgi:hypothetical protein
MATVSHQLSPTSRATSCRRTTLFVAERWPAITFTLLAAAIICGYAFFLKSFWAPAPSRPGIDENAYLVSGKNIAMTGSPALHATDDLQFVGAMWVGTDDQTFAPPIWLPPPLKRLLTARTSSGWFYPKYPIGLPVLNAIAIRLAGRASDLAARQAAFAVSPICALLSAVAMFLLTWTLVESPFYALLALIVLITSPTCLQLSLMPNSHAPALCAVLWGILLLIWFYRGRQSAWSLACGAGAGLLLGFAVTCRYSEALLLFPFYPLDQVLADTGIKTGHPILWHLLMVCRVLPIGAIGLASIFVIRRGQRKSWLRAATPLLAWAIPVGAMLSFNWYSMGHLTGYDTTHESGGFTTSEFVRKWDFAVQHIYIYGLFLFAPLGFAGLCFMFGRRWKDALVLTAWFLPATLLYTSYYWGQQSPGVGFLRFLLTIFPPLIVAAMWLMRNAAAQMRSRPEGSIAESISMGLLTATAACIGLSGSLHVLAVQYYGNINLQLSVDNASRAIAASDSASGTPSSNRIIFADEGLFPQFLQHAQFAIDADWYTADAFEPQAFGGFGFLGLMQAGDTSNSPTLIQPQRVKHMTEIRQKLTRAALAKRQRDLIGAALLAGHGVFAILTSTEKNTMELMLTQNHFKLVQLASWREPLNIPLNLPDDDSPKSANGVDDFPRDTVLVPPFDPGVGLFNWAPERRAVYRISRAE